MIGADRTKVTPATAGACVAAFNQGWSSRRLSAASTALSVVKISDKTRPFFWARNGPWIAFDIVCERGPNHNGPNIENTLLFQRFLSIFGNPRRAAARGRKTPLFRLDRGAKSAGNL
jgi:hypothetical protein